MHSDARSLVEDGVVVCGGLSMHCMHRCIGGGVAEAIIVRPGAVAHARESLSVGLLAVEVLLSVGSYE